MAARDGGGIVQFLVTDDHKFFKAFVQSKLTESVLQNQPKKLLKSTKLPELNLLGK